MALATRCPYCYTTFRVVQDQLKLRNGIVRCGTCKQIFNGSEQLLKQEGLMPSNEVGRLDGAVSENAVVDKVVALEGVTEEDTEDFATEADATEVVSENVVLDEITTDDVTVEEEGYESALAEASIHEEGDSDATDEDLSLILTPSTDFHEVVPTLSAQPLASDDLSEDEVLGWKSFEMAHEDEESLDLDLGQEMRKEPILTDSDNDASVMEEAEQVLAPHVEVPSQHDEVLPLPVSSLQQDEVDGEVAFSPMSAAEPDFMKQVRRQQRYGTLLRKVMIVGVLVLPIILFLQVMGAFHNRVVHTFPSLKPVIAPVCFLLDCQTALSRQIDKVFVEHSELLALDSQHKKYALNVLLGNRSTLVQAWPNIELTLNNGDGNPVARRVFTPVDYLSKSDVATQVLSANSEQLVRLVFELDRLKAAGYLVHIFYS